MQLLVICEKSYRDWTALPDGPTDKESNMNDNVKHPSHYTYGGIETIDYIRAKLTPEEFIGYCKGNALKYISRAGKKGDASEDLAKAAVYLGWASDTPTDAKTAPQTDETPKVDKEPDKVQKTVKKIDDGKLKALYTANPPWSIPKIADEMGISPQTVYNHLEKMGLYKKGGDAK